MNRTEVYETRSLLGDDLHGNSMTSVGGLPGTVTAVTPFAAGTDRRCAGAVKALQCVETHLITTRYSLELLDSDHG